MRQQHKYHGTLTPNTKNSLPHRGTACMPHVASKLLAHSGLEVRGYMSRLYQNGEGLATRDYSRSSSLERPE